MTQRSARSSIVFAGSFNQELISSVEKPVICVHSLFDVIGELATCSASNLVDAVVVDELLLKQNSVENLDAIRRIDPTAVNVVDGSNVHVPQADAVIATDTTAARLASAIVNTKSQPEIVV